MKIEKFKCESCGKTVSVNREHIKVINTGIEFILDTSDIRDSDKIAYLSEHEAGSNFGRVILPDTDIISSILNQIFICCAGRTWVSCGATENAEIIPCESCGGDAVLTPRNEKLVFSDSVVIVYRVKCKKCGAEGEIVREKKQ